MLSLGIPLLDWQMLTDTPSGGFYLGGEGGIANAIVGSIYLAAGATVIAFVISLLSTLWIHTTLKPTSRLLKLVRLWMNAMTGVPTIVFGALAFVVMQFAGARASLGAGMIAVGAFVVPIMTRTFDEAFVAIPQGLNESALSLGATKSICFVTVGLRQTVPGIITGAILGFTRAIGNSATVLFAAGFTDYIPDSLSRPAATLPLSVFFQLSSPIAVVKERAYAAAAVLTIIVLLTSLSARLLEHRLGRFNVR
ncbi:MAG: ABC transporter permease subunit [Spirochaetaceae bacterium]|nr:ABC transporter permease subunit [Spirochaetaceae bacterium]